MDSGTHIGVIGSGDWSRVHLAAWQQNPRVDRITLCGRDAQRVAELADAFGKVRATAADASRLCDEASIDAIDIVLPHHLHAPTARIALAAGKHVICEKPGALSLSEFDDLAAAASRSGRRFFVVMNQLYNPRVEQLRQLIGGGIVGRPFLLVENAYCDHSPYYRDASWRTRLKSAGGGVLIDGGYHMIYKQIDLLSAQGEPRWVTGETAQLNVDPSGNRAAEQGEDFAAYTIGYDGPLRISASHAWTLESNLGRPRACFLAGSDATLEMNSGADGPIALRRRGHLEPLPLCPALGEPRSESTRRCLADFLECLADGRQPQRADLGAARRTLAVILAVYESARQGRRIEFDG